MSDATIMLNSCNGVVGNGALLAFLSLLVVKGESKDD